MGQGTVVKTCDPSMSNNGIGGLVDVGQVTMYDQPTNVPTNQSTDQPATSQPTNQQ